MRFDMIGLFVEDLAIMVRFYREVVGIDTEWDGDSPYAEFKHKGIRFSMFERAQLTNLLGQNPSYPGGINGTFELAMNVGEPSNVDLTFDRMVKGGAQPVYPP